MHTRIYLLKKYSRIDFVQTRLYQLKLHAYTQVNSQKQYSTSRPIQAIFLVDSEKYPTMCNQALIQAYAHSFIQTSPVLNKEQ